MISEEKIVQKIKRRHRAKKRLIFWVIAITFMFMFLVAFVAVFVRHCGTIDRMFHWYESNVDSESLSDIFPEMLKNCSLAVILGFGLFFCVIASTILLVLAIEQLIVELTGNHQSRLLIFMWERLRQIEDAVQGKGQNPT